MKKLIISVGTLLFGLAGFQSSFAQDIVTADTIQTHLSTDSIAIVPASQEEISVVGFRRLVNDITARITAPKRDQNNEICAVIKVVTKDKGLFFEPDALGITAREDQPGEIWLYVPHGSKRITIKHERFGIIRNYFYNESIDKATVYELALHVPQVKENKVIIRQEATEQGLMMNYSPSKAKIYIDDVLQKTNDNGAFTTVLPIGQHNYRVVAPYHEEEKGTFEIVSERPTALNASLQPTYGFMTVSSNVDETNVLVNQKPVGNAPYNSDTISVGIHTVKVERKWYVPQEREVEIKPTETNNVQFALARQKPNVFLLAQMGNAIGDNNQTSFGLMAGVCRKGGAYISLRTNGSPALDWKSESNPYGLYTGKSQKHHLSIAGGFMARLCNPLYFYGGAGILWRNVDWEMAPEVSGEGKYQTVLNHNGPIVEAGLIGRYKCVALSAGFTYAIPEGGEYMEFSIGIGYVFGR